MPDPKFKILPRLYIEKKISRIFWQLPPPLWMGETPTADDIELARRLYRHLDRHTRDWYGRRSKLFGDIFEEMRPPDPEWYEKGNK